MYYTDSFLNEDTYFSQGYIWHFVMMWQGKRCLFCCVSEKKIEKEQNKIEDVLKKWLRQELPYVLEKGALEIQKELTRFGMWLKKWCSFETGVKSPVLHLAVGGDVYSSESDDAVLSQYRGHRGVILKPWCDKTDWSTWAHIENVEELANQWKCDMLKALSKDELDQGYFIMWEDDDDF